MSSTIDQWCNKHDYSRSFWYVLKAQGKAPRHMKVGKAVRISDEADADWVRDREAETAAAAAKIATAPTPIAATVKS